MNIVTNRPEIKRGRLSMVFTTCVAIAVAIIVPVAMFIFHHEE